MRTALSWTLPPGSVLYGAIGSQLYMRGRAGCRFAAANHSSRRRQQVMPDPNPSSTSTAPKPK
ncbi:hypothetical protein [Dactylosporangium sp. NPDC000521]|uniref:hypothetical protein n=1 Tax=Dactylosporangium sp. NPDC000521 TaxID=3363975 RepID=UPI0036AE03F9